MSYELFCTVLEMPYANRVIGLVGFFSIATRIGGRS